MKSMPQEIEIWYLIPALRREIAKILISDFQLSQKEVSRILFITESAVSQYLKSKRGSELQFSDNEKELIKQTANIIYEKQSDANENLYRLCVRLRGCESVCRFHRKHDCSIAENCNLCVV